MLQFVLVLNITNICFPDFITPKFKIYKYIFKKEFEDPTDPFQPNRRRFKIELNRYLSNVNLNYMPPMPKPVYKNSNNNPEIQNRNINFFEHPDFEFFLLLC